MTLPSYGDTPDYNKTLSSSPTLQSFDTGEDTTRLLMGGGSMSRSGRWIWATGFESGTAEFEAFPAHGFAGCPLINTTGSYMGKASFEFRPVGLNTLQQFIKSVFSSAVANAPSSKFGFEGMVSFSSFLGGNDFEFIIRASGPLQHGVTRGLYQIRILVTGDHAGNFYYSDAAGTWILIASANNHLVDSAGMYHYFKLVYDTNAGKYSRFIFDSVVFDLEGIPGFSAAGVNLYSSYAITVKNLDAAAIPTVRIDNIVISADEP